MERLNTGAGFRVGDLLRDHSGIREAGGVGFRADAEAVRTVLSKLHSLRAVVSSE